MLIKAHGWLSPQQKPGLGSEIDWGHPLSRGLVGYWLLNEGGGRWTDYTRQGSDLSNFGGVTLRSNSRGSMAHFTNAQSQYLAMLSSPRVLTGDILFTLAGMVILESKTSARHFLGKYLGTGNQREYLLSYQLSSDRYSWWVSPDGAVVTTAAANNYGSPAVNQWEMIIGWHDPDLNQIGIQVGRTAPNTAAHTTGVKQGTARFCIGTNDGGSSYHDGSIAMAGLWKCLLGSDQRAWLAAEPYAMIRPAGPMRRYFTVTSWDQVFTLRELGPRFALAEQPARFAVRELPARFTLSEVR